MLLVLAGVLKKFAGAGGDPRPYGAGGHASGNANPSICKTVALPQEVKRFKPVKEHRKLDAFAMRSSITFSLQEGYPPFHRVSNIRRCTSKFGMSGADQFNATP
jgi:hypothetical protein